MERQGSYWKTAVIFPLLGPALPAVTVVAILVATSGGSVFLAGSLPMALVLAYATGGIPAAVTGGVCAFLSPRLGSLAAWLVVAALVGAVTSTALLAAWSLLEGGRPEAALWFGAFGAYAALICAYLTRKLRPRMAGRAAPAAETFA